MKIVIGLRCRENGVRGTRCVSGYGHSQDCEFESGFAWEGKPILTADDARDAAVEWSHRSGHEVMTWSEVSEVCLFFFLLAWEFPELENEFRDNGII